MSVIGTPLFPTAPTGHLLTPEEVAEILNVSKRHVRRLAASSRLKRVELGARTTRYTPQSVRSLIEPATTPGADAQPSKTPSNDEAPAGNGRFAKSADAGGGRDSP